MGRKKTFVRFTKRTRLRTKAVRAVAASAAAEERESERRASLVGNPISQSPEGKVTRARGRRVRVLTAFGAYASRTRIDPGGACRKRFPLMKRRLWGCPG